MNNVIARKDADRSVTIQFGGCDGSAANCIPIAEGWNYWARLYRPRNEVIDGTWKFPEAVAIELRNCYSRHGGQFICGEYSLADREYERR